jgi:hypothetical protein
MIMGEDEGKGGEIRLVIKQLVIGGGGLVFKAKQLAMDCLRLNNWGRVAGELFKAKQF